jgi:gliding motility-associated-like protein
VQLTASAADCPIGWLGIANNKSIKVSPQATTLYTVVATNNDGCTDTGYVTVTVDAFNGQLDVRPNPVVAGTTVQMYTSANTNYKVLSWMPFNTSGGKYKTLIADTSLTVKVVTQSASGCIDIDSVQIIVDPLGDVFIPTAFTPNGDGKNDLFTIAGGQFKSFELRIWNRWGEPVFISKERSKGWDGNFANKPQPSGAYVYVLIATLKSGREVQRQGTVTLIR